MHVIVHQLPLLFFCHLTLHGYYDHHIIADTLIVIRKSCCNGYLGVDLLFRDINLQGVRFDYRIVLLNVYADLVEAKNACLIIDNITSNRAFYL